MNKNIIIWILLGVTVILFFFNGPKEKGELDAEGTLVLAVDSTEITQENAPNVIVKNNTQEIFTYINDCPNEPFSIAKYNNGAWTALTATNPQVVCNQKKELAVNPGEQITIDYLPWKSLLFSDLGRYQIKGEFKDGKGNIKEYSTREFSIVEPSTLVYLWRQILYRPIYNLLIVLSFYIPFHSLGIALILLTVIIRLLLYFPSQKAMKAQRKMQQIQPKLQAIKEKHKGDQQRIAQETMRLWSENKVNPLGSCLPLLIQFPVLIALFYVVREGLDINNVHMLYGFLKHVDISQIEVNFLGILDLSKPNLYVLPLILGVLQFAQMKLAMPKKDNNKPKEKVQGEPDLSQVNNMMIYFMPVMIAIFAASLPAGVGIYWAASTIFGIIQQVIVNRMPISELDDKKKLEDGVKVRVVN